MSIGSVLGAVGALGTASTKVAFIVDRLADVGYSHADTLAINTALRNQGSIKDTELEEQKRDHERELERMKFEDELQSFISMRGNPTQPTVKITPSS